MSKAIRIHEAGGPEAMRFEECDPGAPAEGEVQLRHTAIGLNYIDVYDRSGLYPMPLPGGLGRADLDGGPYGHLNDALSHRPPNCLPAGVRCDLAVRSFP